MLFLLNFRRKLERKVFLKKFARSIGEPFERTKIVSSLFVLVFEIKVCQGRNIYLEYHSSILTRNEGGNYSITFNPGPSEYGPSGTSFHTSGDCNFINILRMGGTIVVGNYSQNPEGTYSGTYEVVVNYE